jgi:hypothetical protein
MRALIGILLVLSTNASACRQLRVGDLAPLEVKIVNSTDQDVVIQPALDSEFPWAVNGSNQPVLLAPGTSMTRSWGPDYSHDSGKTSRVTIEANNSQGVEIYCHRFTYDDLYAVGCTIPIHGVELGCQ